MYICSSTVFVCLFVFALQQVALKTFAKLRGESPSDALHKELVEDSVLSNFTSGDASPPVEFGGRAHAFREPKWSSEEREKTFLEVYDAVRMLRCEVQVHTHTTLDVAFK